MPAAPHSCAARRVARRPAPLTLPIGADIDESTKKEIKDRFMAYDRTLLAADPRHRESK